MSKGHWSIIHRVWSHYTPPARPNHEVVAEMRRQIGDPTGVSQTRPQLSPEQVKENASTYLDQIYTVLDPDRTEVVYNSHWLDKLTSREALS